MVDLSVKDWASELAGEGEQAVATGDHSDGKTRVPKQAVVKWIGSVFIGAQAVEDAFVKREEIKAKAGELRPKVTADDPR